MLLVIVYLFYLPYLYHSFFNLSVIQFNNRKIYRSKNAITYNRGLHPTCCIPKMSDHWSFYSTRPTLLSTMLSPPKERKWQIPAINGVRRIPTILPISRQDFHVKGFSRIAKLERRRKLIERVSKHTEKRSKGETSIIFYRYYSFYTFFNFIYYLSVFWNDIFEDLRGLICETDLNFIYSI